MQKKENESLVHSFNQNPNFKFTPKLLALFLVLIVAGILTGYLVSNQPVGSKSSNTGTTAGSNSSVKKGTIEGSNDTGTFKDTAEGVLKQGGIDGEGAFHLVRPGGDSQNVYLTSSIVDLSKYVDAKVKVWGQTQKAQVAGWLMDVGRIEAL